VTCPGTYVLHKTLRVSFLPALSVLNQNKKNELLSPSFYEDLQEMTYVKNLLNMKWYEYKIQDINQESEPFFNLHEKLSVNLLLKFIVTRSFSKWRL
jgi:hypothetical protein